MLELNRYFYAINFQIIKLVKNSKFAIQQGIFWQNICCKNIGTLTCQFFNEFLCTLVNINNFIKIPRINLIISSLYPGIFAVLI